MTSSAEPDAEGVVLATVKVAQLERIIEELGSVVVAFSGGADSTLLLAMCIRVLGADRVLAITADSPTLPRSELDETVALARELGAEHQIIHTDELSIEAFASNPTDRCFYCKRELFEHLRDAASLRGYRHLVYGATAADLGDHRPGMVAAEEAGARAPLLEAGLSKDDVRALSRQLGLRTWDKPAMACLSSRFPYGERITAPALSRVEAAEQLLRRELGFRQVRVRDHDTVARIEADESDIERLLEAEVRSRIAAELKTLGYTYVAVDLQGFRSGSMNETVRAPLTVAEESAP